MSLPTDAKARKNIPIFSGVLKYFPNALAAVAECSKAGNDQHNPGKPLHWDRSKSGDELDALTRHLMQAGQIDSDGIRESTKVAWRALANLEKELEAVQGELDLFDECHLSDPTFNPEIDRELFFDDTPEEVTIENADDNPLDCTACWMRSNLPADTD